MRVLPAVPALLLLSACGAADTDPGPGGVTVGEARALDEAAKMLEERRLPEDTLRPGGQDKANASEGRDDNRNPESRSD